MRLRFRRGAIADGRAAAEWYRLANPETADAFESALRDALARIGDFPGIGSPSVGGLRRLLLTRFPYAVIYREGPREMTIVAIAHTSRRSGYWRNRQ